MKAIRVKLYQESASYRKPTSFKLFRLIPNKIIPKRNI